MIGNTLVSQPMALATEAIRVLEPHEVTENAKTLGISRVLALQLGDGGFDSPHENTAKTVDRGKYSAQSIARSDVDSIRADDDHGLTLIVASWPMLSAEARREMVAFVERDLAAAGEAGELLHSPQPD